MYGDKADSVACHGEAMGQSPDTITLREIWYLPNLIWGSPAPSEWSHRDRDRQPRPCMRAAHTVGVDEPATGHWTGHIQTSPSKQSCNRPRQSQFLPSEQSSAFLISRY